MHNPEISTHQGSLKRKSMVYLALVLCILLLLIATGVTYFTYQAERHGCQMQMSEATANAAYRISTFLNNIENSLVVLGYLEEISPESGIPQEILAASPSISEITILDDHGEVLGSNSHEKPLLTNRYATVQSNWFISARNKTKFISDIQLSPENNPYLIMAVPAKHNRVIAARINMSILSEVVDKINAGENQHSYILDPNDYIIASSDPRELPIGTNLDDTIIPTARPLEYKFTSLGFHKNTFGQMVISSSAPIPNTDWILITESPYQEALSNLTTVITYFFLGFILFGFLVMLGTSQLMNSLLFKPLEKLRNGALRAGAGDLNFSISLKNHDELGKLAESFNEMISNLRAREMMLTTKTEELALEVSERKKIEKQLIHEAYYDALTNLPNRALIVDRLKISIARSKRNEKNLFVVLFLDLDRFKVINDSLGHQFGDKVLVEVAKRLKTTIRESDTIARFGGDEFVILLEDVDDIQDIMHAVIHIQSSISQKFIIDEQEIFTSFSIGIVTNTQDYETPEEFLRDADIALHRAKMLGQSRYAIFDPKMHSWAVKVQRTEADLRNALSNGEFVLYYQPVLSLQNGTIQGFEALIRWQHPQSGLVLPGEFIPIAEDTDIIIELGNWVIKEACQQLVAWRNRFPNMAPLTISVNISGKQLKDPQFIEQIRTILEETRVEPSRLILEITERSLLELSDHVIQTLETLKSYGIRLHLDDFGTGYSSLSVLHEYPIDSIKIDRSFVHRLSSDVSSVEIIRAILQLGSVLKKEVITEGIETEQEIDILREMGCNFGQGFYFSHPHTASFMETYLHMKNISNN